MITYHPICIADGNHRFALEQEGENMLIIIGLNPSTADESHPDQTMQSVLRLINAHGYNGFVMLNLSSERSTKPENMSRTLDREMHERNFQTVVRITNKYPHADVLAAFGNKITIRKYLSFCLDDIWGMLAGEHRCLCIGGQRGITAAGHPRHPLYSGTADGLEPFDMDTYAERMKEQFYGSMQKQGLDHNKIAQAAYDLLATKKDGAILRLTCLIGEIYGKSEPEYSQMNGWISIFKGFYLTVSDYWSIYGEFSKLIHDGNEYISAPPEGQGKYLGPPYATPFELKKRP